MTLDELNHLDPSRAESAFTRCCGSTRWAAAMTAARPFASLDAMRRAGDGIWTSLGEDDWREAFRAHPRIGDQQPASTTAPWSAAEQSGMQAASDGTKARVAALNREYERRFGYIFIVCATGKRPAEMLALVEARMTHDADSELPIAAEEQRKITGLRLAKLVDGHA
jgi:OHCU decarboxylase